MIRYCLFFFLCWLPNSAILVDGQNVAATSSGVVIATNGGDNGLLVSMVTGDDRQQFEITNFGGGVSFFSSFDDVSIDPINENLVFALSTTAFTVCSFLLDGTTTDGSSALELLGCVGVFSVSPFCGVSAYGGTLMISGGTGGFTVYEYDQQSGLIMDPPTLLNQQFPNIIGHPDVLLINANLAALSTDFDGGSSRFGTQMASIDASRTSVAFDSDYRVENTLGFELILQPSNFPLVNAIYRSSVANLLMYTANGPMQVQDLSSSEITVLVGAPDGFSAVTVAVNQAKQKLYFGGVLSSGGSLILAYDLSDDPFNPTLVETKQAAEQRITSIASGGDALAFMTTTNPGTIQFWDTLPDAPVPEDETSANGSDVSPTPDDSTLNETPAGVGDEESGGSSSLLQVGSLFSGTVLLVITMVY